MSLDCLSSSGMSSVTRGRRTFAKAQLRRVPSLLFITSVPRMSADRSPPDLARSLQYLIICSSPPQISCLNFSAAGTVNHPSTLWVPTNMKSSWKAETLLGGKGLLTSCCWPAIGRGLKPCDVGREDRMRCWLRLARELVVCNQWIRGLKAYLGTCSIAQPRGT